MRRPAPLAVLVAAATALLAGCSASAYYWQAFNGEMEVRRLSRPVDEVIAEPGTSSEIRSRLEYAKTARDFASTDLHLPDNRSYRLYADLKRKYVVWNVFAAPALSLTLQTECFPIAGCVSYRGYFSEAAADAYAAELRARGLDVYTGGVPAYSTLGWFDDPLLNTFMHYPELEIARLIFHELGHQVVYVKDDSTFNESFATTVEEEGLRRWMIGHASAEQKARYVAFDQRRAQVMALLGSTREQLAKVYAEPVSTERRLAGKQAVLEQMRVQYDRLGHTVQRQVAGDGGRAIGTHFDARRGEGRLRELRHVEPLVAFQLICQWRHCGHDRLHRDGYLEPARAGVCRIELQASRGTGEQAGIIGETEVGQRESHLRVVALDLVCACLDRAERWARRGGRDSGSHNHRGNGNRYI